MVRRIILLSAVLILGGTLAQAQLDLTPQESFYEVEGIRVPNVKFQDGKKLVSYSPPGGWNMSGGGAKLNLVPSGTAQAGSVILIEQTKEPLPATEANLKAFSELAAGFLPREASKVEVVESVVSPLRISGKSMVEVTLSYVFFGQNFRMNVLYLPREKERLCFQCSARASDFANVLRDFRGSLYSIQGL